MKLFSNTQIKSYKARRDTCVSCGRFRRANTPKMKPYGKYKKQIMVINGCPVEEDDIRGKPLQGRSGRMLQKVMRECGIDLFNDCIVCNAVCCYSDKQISAKTVKCCYSNIMNNINRYKPKLIYLLGDTPVQSVIGELYDSAKLHLLRGFVIPSYNTWISTIYSPSYILDNVKFTNEHPLYTVWRKDILYAKDHLYKALPEFDEKITILIKDQVTPFLKRLQKVSEVCIDIETSGKKPGKGHFITCISFTYKDNIAFVLKTEYLTKKDIELLRNVLENPNIKKIAHNFKYEHIWLYFIYGITTRGWIADTMLLSHISDNRKGITGLKFQTFVRYGIVGYDNEISRYLKSGKNSYDKNDINVLMKNPELYRDLCVYCGKDTIYTYKLYLDYGKSSDN